MVAEGDDALMQEFFDEGTLPVVDLVKGLRLAFSVRRIFPVLVTAALRNMGTQSLLDFIVNVFPDPSMRAENEATSEAARKGENVARKISDAEHVSLFAFKTLADPFAGRITYFKVMSGVLKADANVVNYNRGTAERLQHITVMQGKTATEVPELHSGDIGTAATRSETSRRQFIFCRRTSRNPQSRLQSSRKRGQTKIALARQFTEFWKRICRCGSRAIRRRKNFYSRVRGSSMSKWSSQNCGSDIT
jgi:translation elongation factor EF-G